MIKKLLINNSLEFACDFYDKSSENYLKIRVDCDDIKEIRQAFSDLETISFLSENEIELFKTNQFTAISEITALMDFYIDTNGNTRDGFQIILREPDLALQIKKLEQLVTPTYDETMMTLDELKLHRIQLSKTELHEFLESNPLHSACHGEKEGLYSVTKDKQELLLSNYMSYQIEKTFNPDAYLTWNETGQECEIWTESEIIQLILEIKQYVYPLVALQQKYESDIRSCETQEDVISIILDYENLP